MGLRLAILTLLGLLPFALAKAGGAASPASDGAKDIAELIPQLGSAEFARRQAASQELTEAGKAVFPELERAALEGGREVSGRAIDILKTHFNRGDDSTKQAAQGALERLAKSGQAGAAQRASEALNPPQEPDAAFNGPFGAVPIFRGANIQVQMAARNAFNRRVSIRDVNGQREIEVNENGKKTKITKNANGQIEAEITEQQNGKEVTRKVEAKDLDELKKKDADAAKIFEQYGQNARGNIQIQAGFAPALPALPAIPRIAGPPAAPNADAIKRMIESVEGRIEREKAQAQNNPNAQRIVESLERTRDRLKSMLPAEANPPAEKPAEPAPQPAEKPTDN
ncbi:MAG TPA: hypothetical protein VFV87_12865 [Pirellulaceae bacterium]|nr:hypothetical protein [Pirellulaceae bacterium]